MWGKSKIASSQPQDERRWNFLLMQIRGFCCCSGMTCASEKYVSLKKLFRSHEVSYNPSLFVLSAKLPSHDQVCTCQRSLRLKGWIKFNFGFCTKPFTLNSSEMKNISLLMSRPMTGVIMNPKLAKLRFFVTVSAWNFLTHFIKFPYFVSIIISRHWALIKHC